jgi:hypothetical protein
VSGKSSARIANQEYVKAAEELAREGDGREVEGGNPQRLF